MAALEPLTIGRITIAAEHVEEWTEINEEIHQLFVDGKEPPKELRARAYVLQGMSPEDAKLLASCP